MKWRPMEWPKRITEWQDGSTGYMSVPFTWLLQEAKNRLSQTDLFIRRWIVGGPAVKLVPDYLIGIANVTIGDTMSGVLQRVNPQATRTTLGCIRRCGFCGVRDIEGDFRELDDWPDLPVLCDNNLLAASRSHFQKVIDRLVGHGWCDFNQGLDARLLTQWHARCIARIKRPMVRLALDNDRDREPWIIAVKTLLDAGCAKSRIRSYVLCGFESGPDADRNRCEFVESVGLKALPMWYHPLNAMEANAVTDRQYTLGWTNEKRRQLFCWYYQHRTLTVRG